MDLSKIRVGDEVTVRVKVEAKNSNSILVRSEHNATGYYTESEIATHTPAPREIKVGDEVTLGSDNRKWIVLGLADACAWVKHCGVFRTVARAEMRHAD